jgi:aspartate racemase
MSNPLIGILAGMGPRSTAPFLEAVYDQCQLQYGAKYDIDYPPLLVYSLPTPFYLDRPLDHAALQTAILAGLRQLESAGVSLIAMPCNTAHRYFEPLQRAIGVPLLNIVAEALRDLPSGPRRVALLATPSTLEAGVYQAGLAAAGHPWLHEPEWQERVTALIGMIKARAERAAILEAWRGLTAAVRGAGADTAILACTDLSPLKPETPSGLLALDSGEALAKAVIARYLSLRRE